MGRISTSRMFETPSDGHYFFGYFNTPQVSGDDSKLLALKCDFIDRVPDKSDSAIIGYFDLGKENPAFQKIGTTKAFNWQQGCMLQFCGPDYLNKIIIYVLSEAQNDINHKNNIKHINITILIHIA